MWSLLFVATSVAGLALPRRLFLGATTSVALGPFAASAADNGVPFDVGVVGLKKEGASGRLNVCPDRGIKRACISSSKIELSDAYIPPLVFDKDGGTKTVDQAMAELTAFISTLPGATIVPSKLANGRYLRAEIRTKAGAFGGEAVDDVEFIIALPGTTDPRNLVDFRSSTRPGSDNDQKRHRQRLKDVRIGLESAGWKSVGKMIS
ncbi:hypothetical protein M885DRAFT_507431 [Pelagophyceae sp. CCMP2097]|nr:hypothetical protein M885DRAFT_507431 [Pelagophyceae sp. CCMP2097]